MYEETMTTISRIREKRVVIQAKQKNITPINTDSLIKESWKKIAPFWPLKNLIAINPLKGFENLPIEEAMIEGAAFFQQETLPEPMASINRVTIKWLQAFFDEGQATIEMPLRHQGFYRAWKRLAYFDDEIHGRDTNKKKWLLELSDSPQKAIAECLLKLSIPKEKQSIFLTLMLTTLPGWASHIKYRIDWSQADYQYAVSEAEYLAMRLIITRLLWEGASQLIEWHRISREKELKKGSPIQTIEKSETQYLLPLLDKLVKKASHQSSIPEAQLVFCIDVRSEPFRNALENSGHYETYGFAGFFGLPIRINNTLTEESYSSCPVLLKPKHTVNECIPSQTCHQKHKKLKILKMLYQSLKYNFTTSFALVELLGFATGFWMSLKTLCPILATKSSNFLTKRINPINTVIPSLEDISLKDQCLYAESALRTMGFTKNFSPLVVLCGHGSATKNNAYATALDCGACGGRHGASNARIMAKIFNTQKVREHLKQIGIIIPQSTYFVAAEHNTTTDEVEIYVSDVCDINLENKITKLRNDFEKARNINCERRSKQMGFNGKQNKGTNHAKLRSLDWAQVRPEWGLAQNASFIVAPREISKGIDLEGRAFLHSYDYRQDPDGSSLTAILTAPMVVAQWINSQYLFSTLDNVAYGSGSKITKNITGKLGVIQGNASDLMSGLPLQSVNKTDAEAYHTPVRLMTLVYAPRILIDKIIEEQSVLQNLFSNGWVLLLCIDPTHHNHPYLLKRDLTWERKAP